MPEQNPISDLVLERYALGEHSPAQAAQVERQLAVDPELARRLAALRDSDRELLGEYPPEKMVERIRRRADARPAGGAWRLPLMLTVPSLAAAAALMLLVRAGPAPIAGGVGPLEAGERIKGDARLLAFLVRDGEATPLADQSQVASGAVVQLHYVAAGRPFGAIVSIDGEGGATLHWPEQRVAEARLEPRGQTSLPHAFQLDDAPGFERFFFVTSREPIPADAILEAARAAAGRPDADRAPLELPAAWEQSSLLLRKDAP